MSRFSPLLLLAWTTLALGSVLAAAPARAQVEAPPEDCPAQYDRAQQRYFKADFAQAVALTEACLEQDDLDPDLRVRFLRLLVLAHLERGASQEARQAVTGLLAVRPTYTPDPVEDPPAYAQFVREVKAGRNMSDEASDEAATEGRDWVRWALAGAGVVVTGVLAAVLLGGGGDDGGGEPLPGPPLPD